MRFVRTLRCTNTFRQSKGQTNSLGTERESETHTFNAKFPNVFIGLGGTINATFRHEFLQMKKCEKQTDDAFK